MNSFWQDFFTFRKMVSITIIKFLYILGLFMITLGGLSGLFVEPLAGIDLPPIYGSDSLGKIGLSICYDVRFPELYRYLSQQGADVLFVPAAFTAFTGKDHWKVLLQARAIENTCYIIAPAQTGNNYERRHTHGHAMIIDPWGVVLADAGEEVGVAIAEINPQRLQQVRRQMPSLQHRVFV